MWMDRTLAHATYVLHEITTGVHRLCGYFKRRNLNFITNLSSSQLNVLIVAVGCVYMNNKCDFFLCKMKSPPNETLRVKSDRLFPPETQLGSQFITCPSNHTTFSFLACDVGSDCWTSNVADRGTRTNSKDTSAAASCSFPGIASLPPLFSCVKGRSGVQYTFVCDHRQNCADNSDESFCVFPACPEQQCGITRQCYKAAQYCDGQADCVNEDDEAICSSMKIRERKHRVPPLPPAVIDFAKTGSTTITPLLVALDSQAPQLPICPETHYQCAHNGYCLPTFTRCNGYFDCPYHEDETGCDSYVCSGHYRCFDSLVCVHPSQVCDGVYQCPRSEDESLCDLHCPPYCTCHGLAFTCSQPFPAQAHPDLRYLNVKGSDMALLELSVNTMLIFLSLSDCHLHNVTSITLPNLVILDLSSNRLVSVHLQFLHATQNLKILALSNNPITRFLPKNIDAMKTLGHIEALDLSLISLPTLDQQVVSLFPEVKLLNLSQSGTKRVPGQGFQPMKKLQVLDLKGCPMTEIDQGLLQGLEHLHTVYGDNYKLCCVARLLPQFDINNCQVPSDEISSCQDLLKSNAYRVCLAVFSFLSLVGNGVSFVFRLFSLQKRSSPGFSVFVLHLCMSDFLMGVYLTVVGVADMLYRSRYVWQELIWKQSMYCKLAGLLSLVSCEVSAFIICLITLDRFLVIHFPLSFLRFRGWHAQLASCLSWIVGFALGVVPLLPGVAHWQFYSQTGICLPLPITRKMFAGHNYSFGIMIVLNFVLFLVIAIGQVAIYFSIRSNALKHGRSTQRSQDTNVARRLFTVAMTDFLCWFPVGLLGLLASQEVPVSGEINVVVAINIMPLNSALNPFLYTINLVLQRRQQKKEERLHKWLESRT